MNHTHPISFKSFPNLSVLQAGYPGLRALFFDMDGTLFNTEPHHTKAFEKIGIDHKVRPPYDAETVHKLLMGKADYLVYDIVKDWENFPRQWPVEEFVRVKNQNLLSILAKVDSATYFAREILQLLKEAKKEKFYLALVTSSEKVITKKLLELAGLSDFFDFELTRDDCPNHKPDPWPYLHAIKTSGLAPHEILIFEDSEVGLTAAQGSGAHVIKVEWY